MKTCLDCGAQKPYSEFYSAVAVCKTCYRRRQRRSVLKRKYGLTEAALQRLLSAQRSRCPICRIALDENNLAVDHDHATGRVRGVLCGRCNRSIGMLRDNPKVIRSAVTYLTRRRVADGSLF